MLVKMNTGLPPPYHPQHKPRVPKDPIFEVSGRIMVFGTRDLKYWVLGPTG